MKFVQASKMIVTIVLVVIIAISMSPLVVSAQADWGSDQLIEDNVGYNGDRPQVAISGLNVVAVWNQKDSSNDDRIYSNYSSDGGVTWHGDQLIENNVGHNGTKAQVAISGLNVVAVWTQDDGTYNRVYSNYSSDGGANWGSAKLIEDNTGTTYYAGSPQVAISGSNVVAVWHQHDGSRTRIYSNYSSNAGINWGSDQLIEDNSTINANFPQVAISGLNVVAVWGQGTFKRIYSNYSSDGGVNWGSDQEIGNIGEEGETPQVAMTGLNVVAVWTQKDGSMGRIYSNYSSDGGVNWGSYQLIEDNAGYSAGSPQVAMSGSKAVAVWTQKDGSDDPRVYSNYSSDSGVNWGSDQMIEDNAGYHAGSPQVAMSGTNAIAVWSQNIGRSRIYSNYSGDSGVSWGNYQLIEDNSSNSGAYPQVAMSALDAVAVWKQEDSSDDDRIYSNHRDTGIPLVAGWNMISLPLIPASTNITDIIHADNLASGDVNNLSPIYLYDTATAVWDYWVNGAGTLATMEDGPAYWVYATVADTLTIHGTEAAHPGPDYPVLANWNMTGFTSANGMALQTYLASVAPNYDVVYRWNADTSTWSYWTASANDFDTMYPGCGYWLHMTIGGTITPP